MATVADAERKGIQLSLQLLTKDDLVILLSDSQAAISSVLNLAQGQPPRSHIEKQIKSLIQTRWDRRQDTAISWVKAHVQIPGNEEADTLANWSSHLGETAGCRRTVTEGGVRARGKKERQEARRQETFRMGTATEWNRQALSAYTWMRTGKGPQKQWLHRIGRAQDPFCTCDQSTVQSGSHVTFDCSLHKEARRALIANRKTWGELDSPRWIETGPNERKDGVQEFFTYLFHQFRG